MVTEKNNYVIVNLLPVVAGGGLQNALSFIKSFRDIDNKRDFIFIVRTDTEIDNLCKQCGLKSIQVGNNNWERLKFELMSKSMFSKGQVCFTLFGPVMLGSSEYLNNVVGCAYSNLFYPEVPFWSYLPLHARIKKELIDVYRRKQLSKGDFWLFETEALKRRAIELCYFPAGRVDVVPMAASGLVSPSNIDSKRFDEFSQLSPDRFKFLFLSGAHPNKRLHLLCAIGAQMRKMGYEDFSFITTFEEDTPYAQFVISEMNKYGLSNHHWNIGKISPSAVSALITTIDCMCTFSLLESFSNNFVEAWKMEVPLVVTDGDWSRASCGEGAIYVHPDDPIQCADALISVCSNPELVASLIKKGSKQLSSYPNPEKKLRLYLDAITKAKEMGPCPMDNKKIKWC